MKSARVTITEDPVPVKKSYQNVNMIIEASGNIGSLHLGDVTATQDCDYFKKHKVSCVLTVANCDPFTCPKEYIKYHKVVKAADVPEFKLNEFFKDCFKFIHEHRVKGHSVLVHCMAGISRSATIVIGYLMTVYPTINFEAAFARVRKIRKVVRPNDGFLEQLRQYDSELEDKRKNKQKVM